MLHTQMPSWVIAIIIAIGILAILGIIAYILLRGNEVPTSPTAREDNRPYRIVGDIDGSWWEIQDRQGDMVTSSGDRGSTPITLDTRCDRGQIEMVGISSDHIGPIYCTYDTKGEGTPDTIYGLNPGALCPEGYKKDILQGDDTISFVCTPDIQCVSQNNCASNEVCTGGKCVPISDF